MRYLVTIAPIALLAACAQPEPILNADLPYYGKGDMIRPEPRPERHTKQRRWLPCAEAAWNDDCGSNERVSDAAPDSVEPDRPSVPDVERPGSSRPSEPSEPPVSAPDPRAPEPTPEPPAPEPTPEPPAHEPEPQPEEEWCE